MLASLTEELTRKGLALANKDKELISIAVILADKDKELVSKNAALANKDKELIRKDVDLKSKNKELNTKDVRLSEFNVRLKVKDSEIEDRGRSLAVGDQLFHKAFSTPKWKKAISRSIVGNGNSDAFWQRAGRQPQPRPPTRARLPCWVRPNPTTRWVHATRSPPWSHPFTPATPTCCWPAPQVCQEVTQRRSLCLRYANCWRP